MSDTTTGGKASDTTTGTTNPLSMEDASTLKFIAELQGRIGELEQELAKERTQADRLAEAARIMRMRHLRILLLGKTPYGHECHWCQTCYDRVTDEMNFALAEHAKLREGK